MIEEEFLERFPVELSDNIAQNMGEHGDFNAIKRAIKEHCLSKEKVKEAIVNCLPEHKDLLCSGGCPICKFKKELEL